MPVEVQASISSKQQRFTALWGHHLFISTGTKSEGTDKSWGGVDSRHLVGCTSTPKPSCPHCFWVKQSALLKCVGSCNESSMQRAALRWTQQKQLIFHKSNFLVFVAVEKTQNTCGSGPWPVGSRCSLPALLPSRLSRHLSLCREGGLSSAEAQTEWAELVPHGKELQMFQKGNQC